MSLRIRIAYPCKLNSLRPHFYIVILEFTCPGVYFFQIFALKHILWVLVRVSSYFVTRSFRRYHFGHFVPSFIFSLVISYPLWSFRTQFGHFIPTFIVFD